MAYSPLMGLLSAQDSAAPNLGLMGRLANPEQDPIKAALAQMAAQRPQMAPPQAPGLPGPATPPPPSSGPQGSPEQPPAPPPATPPPLRRRPLLSPTQAALFTAGADLASQDAPTLLHAVSRALASGAPAFMASKQANRDLEDANAAEVAYRSRVDNMVAQGLIPATVAAVARGLGSAEGGKLLAEVAGRAPVSVGVGGKLVDPNTRKVIAEGAPETKVAGDILYGVGTGADGQPNATALTAAPKTPAAVTDDTKEFVAAHRRLLAQHIPEGVDPTDPQSWGPEVSEAFNKWIDRREELRSPKAPQGREGLQNNLFDKYVPVMLDERKVAQGAVRAIPSIDTSLRLLKDMPTGRGAMVQVWLDNTFNKVGLGDGRRAANAEAYLAQITQQIAAVATAEGNGGFRGVTNEEWEILQRANGGDITYTRQGLEQILTIARKAARSIAMDHNERVSALFGDGVDATLLRVKEPPAETEGSPGLSSKSVQELWDMSTPAQRDKYLRDNGGRRPPGVR